MADNTSQPIEVGGEYVENPDFIPSPTDQVAQFNTSGTGAHGKIEEIAPVFEVDKVKTAQEILAALDPENTNVSSDKVLLPDPLGDNEQALASIKEKAQARVDQGVVIGGPTPAEREAALEGDEGTEAAVAQERENSGKNSTGGTNAGRHTSTEDPDATGAATVQTTVSKQSSDDAEDNKAPAESAVKADWVDYAVSQGANREEAEAGTKQDLVDKYGG